MYNILGKQSSYKFMFYILLYDNMMNLHFHLNCLLMLRCSNLLYSMSAIASSLGRRTLEGNNQNSKFFVLQSIGFFSILLSLIPYFSSTQQFKIYLINYDLLNNLLFQYIVIILLDQSSIKQYIKSYVKSKVILYFQKFQIMNYQVRGNSQTDVYLNVYDLDPNSNGMLYNMGLGFYHTGIHLGLNEYTFAGHNGSHTGVMQVVPKTNTPNLRQSIHLGKTQLHWRQITKILDQLRQSFPGNSYHVLRKNCNSFSNAFCQALLGKSIPGFVNRMANIGRTFLEIDDFIRMRPYENKYEIRFNQLKNNQNVFEGNKNGVMIG